MSKKLIALLLAAMMMLSLAAACGNDAPAETPTQPTTPAPTTPAATTPTTPAPTQPADPDADKYGGDLIVATTYVSSTMDPHYSAGSTSNYYWMQYVYEVPFAWGADGKVYPLICDYTESADCTEFTMTVRDYYFSNGEKVTAEDVLASLERRAAVGGGFQNNYWSHMIEKKIEGDTIYLKADQMLVDFIWEMGDDRGPAFIMPKAICDKYPDGAQITDQADVIGTGPYLLGTYKPDTEVSVVRNDAYIPTDNGDVGGHAQARKAYLDSITWKVNSDAASRTAGMIAGDYHVGSVLTEMQAFADQIGLKRDLLENQWTHAIFFNLDESNADSPVADVNFRKAIRAALNCDAIMLSVMQGDTARYTLDINPMVPQNTTYACDIIQNAEYNIADKELAKSYLAKTNYNGEPIKWLVSANSAFYRAAMAAIPMLEEIGINVELQVADSGSHGALRSDPANGHDIGAWETQKAVNSPLGQGSFITGTAGGWWTNDKKTELLQIIRTNPNGSDASVKAYEEFCQLIADEVPWIGFGTGITQSYSVPELVLNYTSIYSIYWNSYFQK